MNKKHKLYFKKGPIVRNVAKVAPKTYLKILTFFLKNGGNGIYADKNKNAKKLSDIQPLDMLVTPEYEDEFAKLTKDKEVIIYYNGTIRPLVKLYK